MKKIAITLICLSLLFVSSLSLADGTVFKNPAEDALVKMSKELLENKRYFSRMLIRHDTREMNAYLLLLAEAHKVDSKVILVSLNDLAASLNINNDWTAKDERKKTVKVLRKLQKKYRLIKADFTRGEDAWVEIKDIKADDFWVKGASLAAETLNSRSPAATLVALMNDLLLYEDNSIQKALHDQLRKRFHVAEWVLKEGIEELGLK